MDNRLVRLEQRQNQTVTGVLYGLVFWILVFCLCMSSG